MTTTENLKSQIEVLSKALEMALDWEKMGFDDWQKKYPTRYDLSEVVSRAMALTGRELPMPLTIGLSEAINR